MQFRIETNTLWLGDDGQPQIAVSHAEEVLRYVLEEHCVSIVANGFREWETTRLPFTLDLAI
jgi:hypothetical protein